VTDQTIALLYVNAGFRKTSGRMEIIASEELQRIERDRWVITELLLGTILLVIKFDGLIFFRTNRQMCLPKHLKLLPKKHTFCLGVINPS